MDGSEDCPLLLRYSMNWTKLALHWPERLQRMGSPCTMGKEMCANVPTMLSRSKVSPRVLSFPVGWGSAAPTDTLSLWCCHAGALGGSSCPFGAAMALLRKPSFQVILAAGVALAAGLLAWYYM